MFMQIRSVCRPVVSGSSSALFDTRLGSALSYKYVPRYYASSFTVMDVYKRKGPPRKTAIEGEANENQGDMKHKFNYATHEHYVDKKMEQRWNRAANVEEDVMPTPAEKRRLVLTMLYPNMESIPEYVAFNVMEKMRSRMRIVFYLTLSVLGFTFMYVLLIGLHNRILRESAAAGYAAEPRQN